MTTFEEIKEFLHDLSVKVSSRLRANGFGAKTIHLTIKFADFTCVGAQSTKPYHFSNEQDIFKFAYEIFCELVCDKFNPIRALRICTTNLINKEDVKQVNLFSNEKNESLCSAIDKLKTKFGNNIISLAKDFREF